MENRENKRNSSGGRRTRSIVLCGVFAALTAALSQISIPFPGGVPFTLQTFAVLFAGLTLGSKRGFAAMAAYVLMGAAGLPVFAGFTGGLHRVIGPTGGFLLSFPIMAAVMGMAAERARGNGFVSAVIMAAGAVAAEVVNYGLGTAVFCAVMNVSVGKALSVCVVPFILPDMAKAFGAVIMSNAVKAGVSALPRRS